MTGVQTCALPISAQAEARRVVREQKKAERKEALEDRKAAVEKRWEELKDKFS